MASTQCPVLSTTDTTERVVGVYDGKLKYEKVVKFKTSDLTYSGTLAYYDISSLSIEKVLSVTSAIAKNINVNPNRWDNMQQIIFDSSGLNAGYSTYVSATSANLIIEVGTSIQNRFGDWEVTIQYTKTS